MREVCSSKVSVNQQLSKNGNHTLKIAQRTGRVTDIDGYALVCLCSFGYNRSGLFLVVFTGNVCNTHLEITLLIQIMYVQ